MSISFHWLYYQRFLLYPLFLAAYPITFWYSENVGEAILSHVWVTAFAVLAITALLTAILQILIRDNVKTATLVGILLVAFFSFGRIRQLLFYKLEVSISGIPIAQEQTLAIIFLCTVFITTVIVLRYGKGLQNIIDIISLVAILMVAINIISAANANTKISVNHSSELSVQTIDGLDRSRLPDIYYIILDSYGREDVLRKNFSFDNKYFIDNLIDRGFFVADRSNANYPLATELSLASLLNMRYLRDFESPVSLIEDNIVISIMKSMGYKYVHIGSGFYASNTNRNADIQLSNLNEHPFINEFSMALLNDTMASPLSGFLGFNLAVKKYTQKHAKDFNDSLAWLKSIPKINGPTFTFSHNFPPHSPFVFDRDGNILDPNRFNVIANKEEERTLGNQAYIDQLVHVNQAIMDVIDVLLEQSEPEVPIIILQGDHGPPSSTDKLDLVYYILERTPTLNAFLLPNHCESVIYPEISLVNSFRALLNSCFKGELDLLKDETYWGSFVEPLGSRVDFSKDKDYQPHMQNSSPYK